MTTATKARHFTVGDNDTIADLVTSDSEMKRLAGRALASGYPAAIQDWVNAELARDTDIADLLSILVNIHVQSVASITASLVRPEYCGEVRDLFLKAIEVGFMKHVDRAAEILEDSADVDAAAEQPT